jgi:DNA-binding CsgD family transcriptional regulator
VLDTAALIGTRVDPRLLAAATGCPPDVLDDLVGSGLLVGAGAGLRFRHELARLAVEQAVPVHRVAGIHAGLLAALVAAGSADDASMAYHAEAAGDGPAALRHAVRAARRAAELKSHREAAAQYRRAVRVDGDDPELLDALGRELSMFDAWPGVVAAVDRALVLWRAAGDRLREGSGPRTATRANAHGLTRRQQQVFDLVREGLTNAEIAARLVLSVKTVDHHVSAVLAKLGVATRAEAIRKVAIRKVR